MIYIAVKIIDATRHCPEKLRRLPVQLDVDLLDLTMVSSDMAITTQLRTKGIFPFATNSPFNRVSNLRIIGKVAFVNKYYINNNDNTIIMN